ncbi:MAG: glycosyltransferase family 39 protein [Chloroflexi bacterium]|nr:glycosyltransferase family 39 protein [Chloroflexota bacterium]
MAHPSTLAQADWPLALILVCYFILGGLFAVLVPPWQVPDEPAHYNYVRQLAQTGAYPVIAVGDYDQDLIANRIAPPAARPDFSLDAVQYEDHQPPLFYTLAAPVFLLFNGALIPLRLFSLFIGAFVVVFGYLAVRTIFPAHPHIAAFAVAFIALLPQHLHMMAGFNNDSLSEALIALTVWLCARLIVEQGSKGAGEQSPVHPLPPSPSLPLSLSPLLLIAVVVGLAFLTKVQAYLALPVALFAILVCLPKGRSLRDALLPLIIVIAIAGVIGLPWWIHGLQVYGGTDLLGLQRHNVVVAGQPTTAEWIAQYGWGGLLSHMVETTFQSFWGQFGWMSIVIDRRLYLLFLAASAVSALLFLAWWVHGLSAKARLKGHATTSTGAGIYSPYLVLTREQTLALDMLAVLALGALLGFIWYNLQFVQHQGRYLFSGLIPIATALSLGWHFIVSRKPWVERWLWLALLLAFIALDGHMLFRVILPTMQGG